MCSLSDKPEMACDRHILLAKCLIPRVHAHAHDPTDIKYPILHSAHEFQQTCTESIATPSVERRVQRRVKRRALLIERRVSGRALESASSDDRSAFFFALPVLTGGRDSHASQQGAPDCAHSSAPFVGRARAASPSPRHLHNLHVRIDSYSLCR